MCMDASALTEEELRRAERFAREDDRRRFVVGRSVLRSVLGALLGAAPQEIAFEVGAEGKLAVRGDRVKFNLSHSGEHVAIALSADRWVGIDVEAHRTVAELGAIAERYFTVQERRQLAAAPPEEQLRKFFAGWTRKEAWAKATGLGLLAPVAHCEVSLELADGHVSLVSPTLDGVPQHWHLWSFGCGAGASGALVYSGAQSSPQILL